MCSQGCSYTTSEGDFTSVSAAGAAPLMKSLGGLFNSKPNSDIRVSMPDKDSGVRVTGQITFSTEKSAPEKVTHDTTIDGHTPTSRD